MPLVTCPGCARRIELDDEDLQLLAVHCLRCGTNLDPRTGYPVIFVQTPPPGGPWSRPEPPPFPDPLPLKTRPNSNAAVAIVACTIIGALLLCAGLVVKHVKQGGGLPGTRGGIAEGEDPYAPDCAIIRAWLREHYGDVEVVSWGRRGIHRFAALDDFVTLSVRFRVGGERRAMYGHFTIGPGNIVKSASVSD
jgi:hypothetical protein